MEIGILSKKLNLKVNRIGAIKRVEQSSTATTVRSRAFMSTPFFQSHWLFPLAFFQEARL